MTAPAFDGTAYRKDVLAPLREGNPAEVEDLFWLANVPRDVDDDAQVAARLRAARGFLNKELSRARQAAVASAVLKEWPRVERGLGDAAGRRALRERLERGGAAAAPKAAPKRKAASRNTDPAARRRRQVAANLQELARLRDEPELAEDLFAFLGLPTTAGRPTIEERLAKVGEVNRRRRADRERTLTDELLAHARELLVAGDPAAYLEGFGKDAAESVVDALLGGDGPAARAALADARAAGIADATILAAIAAPAKARVAEVPDGATAGGAARAGATARGAAGADDAKARDASFQGAGTVPVSATGLGVWCPACGTIAPPHAVRCTGCEGAVTVICASCRTQSPADLATCPSCSANLDEVRAPLIARRAERAEEDAALAAVDAAPAAERPARLAALAAAHPGWVAVRRRLDALPPAAPAQVLVSYSSGDARLEWPVSAEPGVDAYLVERIDGPARRVLGRTGTTTWTDRAAPGDAAAWEVRALRGEVASPPTRAISAVMARSRPTRTARRAPGTGASSPAASGSTASPSSPSGVGAASTVPPGVGAASTVPPGAGAASTSPSGAGASTSPTRAGAASASQRASTPPATPSAGAAPRAPRGLRDLPPPAVAPAGLHEVQAQPGPPVRVSWRAPAGSRVLLVRTERRPEGAVRRNLTVDPGVYVDRHVGRGRTYEYELRLAGDPGDPQVVRVEAGAGGIVRAITGGTSSGSGSGPTTEGAAASQPAAGPAPPPEVARSPAAASVSTPAAPAPPATPAAATSPPAAPTPSPAAPPADGMGPIRVQRDAEGRLVARWTWPVGVTEAFVAWGATPPEGATEAGRKVTNMRYELDDGAVLRDVPPGAHVAVMAGRREASGVLVWGAVDDRSRAVAP